MKQYWKFRIVFFIIFLGVSTFFLIPMTAFAMSLGFDGTSEVRLPSNIAPANITIESWFSVTAFEGPASWEPLITKETGNGAASDFAWRLGIETGRPDRAPYGSLVFQVSDEQYTAYVNSDTLPNMDEWYHVAATYDGLTLRLYVNGILEDEGTDIFCPPPSVTWDGGDLNDKDMPTGIGHLLNWDIQYFEGYIDELRIWDYARTLDEILSDKDSALTGNEAGLLAYWDFEPGPNPAILYDRTGNGYDGVIVNAQWSDNSPFPTSSVPEPSTLFLLCGGLIGLVGFRKRKRNG